MSLPKVYTATYGPPKTKVSLGGSGVRRNMALRAGGSRLLQLNGSLLCHQYPTLESVYSPVGGSANPSLGDP